MVRDERGRIGPMTLPGEFVLPPRAVSLVVLAYGSVRGWLSPHHRHIAAVFKRHGIATLPFELLDDTEGVDRDAGVDPVRLGRRVARALDWAVRYPPTAGMRLGLFGADAGADAAFVAAAERPGLVAALVACGGGPGPGPGHEHLARVEAPTLLISGSGDAQALARHRIAFRRLHCERRLEVLPGAGRRFEEPGALESVAALSATWFGAHLQAD